MNAKQPASAPGFQPNPALQAAQAKMAALRRNPRVAPPAGFQPNAALQRAQGMNIPRAVARPAGARAGAFQPNAALKVAQAKMAEFRGGRPPIPAPPVYRPPGPPRGNTGAIRVAQRAVVQPYFTHNRAELNDKDQLNAIYANLSQLRDKKTADEFWKNAVSKKDKGSLRGWLDENDIKTAVKDLLVAPDSGFLSDVGSDTEAEMMEAEETVSSMKKGDDRQQKRKEHLVSLGKHVHSSSALHLATKIAVGDASSQTTSALLRTNSNTEYFQLTTSSAPLQHWLEKRHSAINILEVGRNTTYPDGSHVHAEMRGLAALLREGKTVTHVIVSKQVCPVCYAVLEAFGVEIVDPVEAGAYFSHWGNPFKKLTEAAWFTKADNAAQEHSESCKILKPV